MKKYLYNYVSSSSYKLADEQPSVSYILQTDEISYLPKIVLGTLDEFLQFLGVNSISDIVIYKLVESDSYIGINRAWSHTYVLVNKFQIKEVVYPSEINSDTYFDYDKVSYDDSITGDVNFIITKDLLKQLSGVSMLYYYGGD